MRVQRTCSGNLSQSTTGSTGVPVEVIRWITVRVGGFRLTSRKRLGWSLGLVGLSLACLTVLLAAQQPGPRVYVLLWFDTEDYILPQSGEAAKRLAVFLSQRDIPATFKVVGEVARVYRNRNREDVIAALAKHEIGYHTRFHSRHPTPAQYLNALGWEDGVEEFDRRERPGLQGVRRLFGKAPTCFGQPGASWAPQIYGALRKWGISVYLGVARHVRLKGKPFWYGGVLNFLDSSATLRLRPNADFTNLDEVKNRFSSLYERRLAEGGGVISIYYHPCEFVHREFSDQVNFARGANPPPAEWKPPPTRSVAASEAAFAYFQEFVDSMTAFPRIRFITASQVLPLFRDGAQKRVFSRNELSEIARGVDTEISHQIFPDYSLAPSEIFTLLTLYLASQVREEGNAPITLSGTPLGPSRSVPVLREPLQIRWDQFFRTVLDVQASVRKTKKIPSPVWFGSTPSPPESYLAAVAEASRLLLEGEPVPDIIEVPPARLADAQFVAEDSPALWDWVIFPEGFSAPHLIELAKLQAWTLKPALFWESTRKR